MKSLLVFESKTFVNQLTKEDDIRLIQIVLQQYLEFVQQHAKYWNPPGAEVFFEAFMEDAYLAIVMDKALGLSIVDDDGGFINLRLRFRELMEILADHYTDEIVATLKTIIDAGEKINTIEVVGYDKYKLSFLVHSEVNNHDSRTTHSPRL